MKDKNSEHIRIRKEDKEKWKKFCEMLRVPSAKLFSKILTSQEINLEERIRKEYTKKEEKFKREFGQFK